MFLYIGHVLQDQNRNRISTTIYCTDSSLFIGVPPRRTKFSVVGFGTLCFFGKDFVFVFRKYFTNCLLLFVKYSWDKTHFSKKQQKLKEVSNFFFQYQKT